MLTHTRAKHQSVRKIQWKRTDRRTDRRTEAIVVLPSLSLVVYYIAQLMSFDLKATEHVDSSIFKHRYTEFASESARLKSFENGRVGKGQSAQALSRAGFFYLGTFESVRAY